MTDPAPPNAPKRGDHIVVVDNVSRVFRPGGEDVWALRDVTMSVPYGDFVALVGRSGSGKTTLLNIIAALDAPSSGTVIVDGADMNKLSDRARTIHRRNTIGFVFQSFGLLPLLSAEENVELALRIGGVGARERGERSREVLDLVGLGQRRKHRPYELSGGEQQRVAIARAISGKPTLIIADEPTAELDSTTALQIFGLLRDLALEQKATVITTTHDPMLIEQVDSVVELSDGMVVGESVESDLMLFGKDRRRVADEAFSSPRAGSTAGDFLGSPHHEPEPPPERPRPRPQPTTEGDPSRWAPPPGRD